MKYLETNIPDVWVLTPEIHTDARGHFYECFKDEEFMRITGQKLNFVQENVSESKLGVIRGLHYQKFPVQQGKLIRVTRGGIFDVAVDIRKGSGTYGKWVSRVLSDTNNEQLWIPPGFAHGFQSLTDGARVHYRVTNYFSPSHEGGVAWNDEDLNIDWPIFRPRKNVTKAPQISEKDMNWPTLKQLNSLD